jgi:hypothetical protein
MKLTIIASTAFAIAHAAPAPGYAAPPATDSNVQAETETIEDSYAPEAVVESEEEEIATYQVPAEPETEVKSEEETIPEPEYTPAPKTYAPTTNEKPEEEVTAEYVGRPARECDGEIMTIVEDGDNMWDLANTYDKDFEMLLAANGHLGPDFDLIYAKDEVCVPKACGEFNGPDVSPYGDSDGFTDLTGDNSTDIAANVTATDLEDIDDDEDFVSIAQLESSANSVSASLMLGVATLFVYLM